VSKANSIHLSAVEDIHRIQLATKLDSEAADLHTRGTDFGEAAWTPM
jgi:hypothetical protein